MRTLIAIVLTLLGGNWAIAEVQLPPKPQFHLYLLIGQSNMAGRGTVEAQDQVPHPRVLVFNKDSQWAPAVDPLHFDKPQIAGVGLGSTFGRQMADSNPDVTIGLIPCAVGGTPLSRWSQGKDLYQAALERAKEAMKVGTLKGILWHQGEAECNNQQLAETYAQRLDAMVSAWRADLDAESVPFVCGKLGEFLYPQERFPFARTVNQALETIGERVPHSACVDSAGLTAKSDQVHFDAASYREFGKRYAEAMRKLQGAKP